MNNADGLKRRFTVESVLAAITGFLAILTLINHEWIEVLTGWDPDNGNGSVEWAIVVVLVVACIALATRARADWQKLHTLGA